MGRLTVAFCTAALLLCASLAAVEYRSVIGALAVIALHFLLLKIIPIFRKRESVWMFIFVIFSTAPFNLYVLRALNDFSSFFDNSFLLGLIECVVYYAIMFSIEEIAMGVVTRFFWRKQKNVFS